MENLKFIQKMRNELTKYYDDKPAMSCVPVEGTDVIAKYEHNVQGKWHRATVTSVNVVNKQVDVYFIDWGYSTVLPWSSIKLLSENFIRMECQVVITSGGKAGFDFTRDLDCRASFLNLPMYKTLTPLYRGHNRRLSTYVEN